MKRVTAVATVLALLGLAGCGENRFDRAETGTGMGAVTGAGVGALVGPVGVATGALIGAGAGAAAGIVTNPSDVNLGEPFYR